jgi:hypothetical protein
MPLGYAVILFQNGVGGETEDGDGFDYWEDIGEPNLPVTSNNNQQILDAADYPYPGSAMPGRVLLSPQMEIIGKTTGHQSDQWAWDIVREREGL